VQEYLKKLPTQSLRLLVRTIITGLLVILFIVGIRQAGWLESLELYAYDWHIRLRADIGPDPRLLIIGITEKDIQKYKKFPLPDEKYTQVLQQILQFEPAVVGLDVYRDFPQGKGNKKFLKLLQENEKIVVIQRLSEDGSTAEIPPPSGVPKNRVGFNDFALDRDGVIRRNLIHVGHMGQTHSSLSWVLARHYLQHKGIYPQAVNGNAYHIRLGKAVLKQLTRTSGNYQQADAEGYQILLNYRPTKKIAEQVSFSKVLEGQIKPEQVKNRIVLIGTVAESARDIFVTPFSRERTISFYMPGVEVHAAQVSELISVATGDAATTNANAANPRLFEFWDESVEILWIVMWGILGGGLAWFLRHPLRLLIALSSALILLFLAYGSAFNAMLWVPFASPLLALILVSASVLTTRYVYYAFYDELTGLPNRTLFIQRLRRLHHPRYYFGQPQSHKAVALLLLDLERFKVINAVLGHDAGDDLLVAFTQRVENALEEAGHLMTQPTPLFLARVGGTEFGVIFKTADNDYQTATQLANNVRSKMHHPFRLHNEEIFTHANIGIAIGYIDDQRDLLRDARSAMNRAKLLEKDAPEIFEVNMEEKAIEHFKLERDLRRATHYYRPGVHRPEQWSLPDMQEFFLHYQPLINLKTGGVAGFEALVRWQHPQRGMVSPGEFIPVAEETGLILPMGEWILYQACLQMYEWQKAFPHYEELVISVNLSGRQFSQPFLSETIQAVIQASGLSPEYLKLEITESAVMDDIQNTLSILKRLKSVGVQLSIDDFGTGYSSLEYLTQFPTDTLKVDQSFVRRMFQTNQGHGEKNQVIVETIVELAHRLSMNVICEGIEEQPQLTRLRDLGCEYGQGYFFSKPLPQEQATELLANNPTW